MNEQAWLNWIIELQSLAQAGLTYGKDVYDRERYTRIREISAEMLAQLANLPVRTVTGLFCNESGYQTPKIDTRAAIFDRGRLLLVHENNGTWALPGGWCDVNVSVGGAFAPNSETTESRYFAEDALPLLAEEKNNAEQIRMCFAACRAAHWHTLLE